MVTTMSPAKLTSVDKQNLVDLYRRTPATTSTLAERFGVSVSTVSRLLKSEIASQEYESLVQEKRGQRGIKSDSQLTLPWQKGDDRPSAPPSPGATSAEAAGSTDGNEPTIGGIRKRRRTRSSKQETDQAEVPVAPPSVRENSQTEPPGEGHAPQGRPQIVSIKANAPEEEVPDPSPDGYGDDHDPAALEDDDLEDDGVVTLGDDDEDFENALDDDDLEEDDGDDEDDDADFFDQTVLATEEKAIAAGGLVIAPFATAPMPKDCYLVVDRMGDLIVRPLNQFTVRGTIPTEEKKEKTLPIFENHRVARRFSLRTQKVIKIPNAALVQKASPALKAKGITRVFLNGKVYSL